MSNQEYDAMQRQRALQQMQALQNMGVYSGLGQAAVLTEDQRARRKAKLDETRQLKGTFMDYTTENPDVSSPCEVLPPDYQAFLDSDRPVYSQPGEINVEDFRSWCEELDKDKEWIAKTEKELF